MQREGGGRDWRVTATSQEIARIVGSHQKLEEAWKDFTQSLRGSTAMLIP